jgi:hypothetical protein
MSIRHVVIRTTAASVAGLTLLMAGCVSTSGEVQGARLTDNFQIYAPFDNERDWGPSYLAGAPSHHLGDETRIDDTRSIPPSTGASPADPNGPPLTGSPPPTPPPQPPP